MESDMSILNQHLESAPVNLRAIFRAFSIEYEEVPMESGTSGLIIRNGDRYTISVNANDVEVRRRFTAAHELGHYLLHRDLMGNGDKMHRHVDNLFDRDKRTSETGDVNFKREYEVQANRMAAGILMPKKLVIERHGVLGGDLAKIAQEFKVSKAAMEIRLKTLGLRTV